jgi:hypothetical protein
MNEECLNPFRKSSRTERSLSRSEEGNQSQEIEKKIKTVLREIKEDVAGIVEESKVRRKELAAVRKKKGEQEREIVRSKKESSKREREEGRMSKEDKNPLRNSSRTRRSPNRSKEENQSKEMDKE